METTTLPENATPVEGSDGLLLEIDGQIVPNYDATLVPFEEGDVVSGKVVRIDQDEVLVDIRYKSEGVIPSNELSIRKSVDPADEVEIGEEVDALVLTKEDQDGRLVLSKKRARFEKAWRRIEAAADSGPAVEGEMGRESTAPRQPNETQEARLGLPKRRARCEGAWRRLEAPADSGEPVEGWVIEVVRGALIIDPGVRGFLPASLVDIRR